MTTQYVGQGRGFLLALGSYPTNPLPPSPSTLLPSLPTTHLPLSVHLLATIALSVNRADKT